MQSTIRFTITILTAICLTASLQAETTELPETLPLTIEMLTDWEMETPVVEEKPTIEPPTVEEMVCFNAINDYRVLLNLSTHSNNGYAMVLSHQLATTT